MFSVLGLELDEGHGSRMKRGFLRQIQIQVQIQMPAVKCDLTRERGWRGLEVDFSHWDFVGM